MQHVLRVVVQWGVCWTGIAEEGEGSNWEG